MKNPLTPAGIEPATFRFVAQHLNRCAITVPTKLVLKLLNCSVSLIEIYRQSVIKMYIFTPTDLLPLLMTFIGAVTKNVPVFKNLYIFKNILLRLPQRISWGGGFKVHIYT